MNLETFKKKDNILFIISIILFLLVVFYYGNYLGEEHTKEFNEIYFNKPFSENRQDYVSKFITLQKKVLANKKGNESFLRIPLSLKAFNEPIMESLALKIFALELQKERTNLSDLNLSGLILSDIKLNALDSGQVRKIDENKNIDFSHTNFKNSNLQNVDFSNVDLSYADFSGADLTNANLEGAILINARFDNANLDNANLQGAKLIGADLSKVLNLEKAKLNGAIYNSKPVTLLEK